MTELQIAAKLLELSLKLGTAIADGVRDLLTSHRPDLLPGKPAEEQGSSIEREDDDVIARRFPKG